MDPLSKLKAKFAPPSFLKRPASRSSGLAAAASPAKRGRTSASPHSPEPDEDVDNAIFAANHGARVVSRKQAPPPAREPATPDQPRSRAAGSSAGRSAASASSSRRVVTPASRRDEPMDEDEDELSDGPVQPARRPLSKSCATPSKGPSREHILRQNETIAGADRYYLCYWRKPQGRKHKTWDGDAVLIVKGGGKCTLRCTQSFRDLATDAKLNATHVGAGDELVVGGKEIEIDTEISASAYYSGCNGKGFTDAPSKTSSSVSGARAVSLAAAPTNSFYAKPLPKPVLQSKPVQQAARTPRAAEKARAVPTPNKAVASAGRGPSGLANPGQGKEPHPRYDPLAPGAIVMKRPDKAHQKKFNRRGLPVVDVVVEPTLASALRPHQVEGVKWLYEKVMGMNAGTSEDDGMGAILADEMGLGKTLQTIALLHTMLKQDCYYTAQPHAIERAVIVCPLSLTTNWKREFRKWLGTSGLSVLCVDSNESNKVERFLYSTTYQVLIIGYEKLRTCVKLLADAQPPIGLIVCDEGHRLKSRDAKTTKMFAALSTPRRIILSGTPVQNDLSEFYAMIDFVNPGLLGDYATFKKVFEDPIVKSRVQHARKDAQELGRVRTESLSKVTKSMILRRPASLLDQYLQPKCEQVVFCAPTQLQLDIYGRVLGSDEVSDVLRGAHSGASSLPLIGVLRKLCNSPELLLKDIDPRNKDQDASMTATLLSGAHHLFPTNRQPGQVELSGKLMTLLKMLKRIRDETDDKVVLVSNFTATLDVVEAMCRRNRFTTLRLDGSTKQDDRMDIVSEFNRGNARSSFVFLLSTKTGGQGLNLIGANRLVLIDSDWNPSVDKQAMARIHRDGQKKRCYIYRLLLAGTMDEKIYQRQISKIGLSDSLMEGGNASSKASDSFSLEDLRDIFSLHCDTPCVSHDAMRCTCGGNGIAGAGRGTLDADEYQPQNSGPGGFVSATQQATQQEQQLVRDSRSKLAALHEWGHFDCSDTSLGFAAQLTDTVLRDLILTQQGAKKPAAPPQQARVASPAEEVTPLTAPAKSAAAGSSLLSMLSFDALQAAQEEEARKAAMEQAQREAVVCKAPSRKATRDMRGGRVAPPPDCAISVSEARIAIKAEPDDGTVAAEEDELRLPVAGSHVLPEPAAPGAPPREESAESDRYGLHGRAFDIKQHSPGDILFVYTKTSGSPAVVPVLPSVAESAEASPDAETPAAGVGSDDE